MTERLFVTLAIMGGIPGSACKTDQAEECGVAKKSPPEGEPAGFEPYVVVNECRYFVDLERDNGIFVLNAVLKGSDANEPAMFVRGNCRYINKDDVNVKLQRTDQGWSCDFTTYRILLGDDPTLPVVAAQDYRGPYANADYWGKKPQPRFEDQTISLDEFSMDGPGRLSLTCLSTINPSVGALSDCKIAWYNQFVPESSNFHGVCGDKVSIPGFYVSTKKDR